MNNTDNSEENNLIFWVYAPSVHM